MRSKPKLPALHPSTQELVDQVRRYIDEKECPAPDMTMRRVEFGRMKAALRAWDLCHADVLLELANGDGGEGERSE